MYVYTIYIVYLNTRRQTTVTRSARWTNNSRNAMEWNEGDGVEYTTLGGNTFNAVVVVMVWCTAVHLFYLWHPHIALSHIIPPCTISALFPLPLFTSPRVYVCSVAHPTMRCFCRCCILCHDRSLFLQSQRVFCITFIYQFAVAINTEAIQQTHTHTLLWPSQDHGKSRSAHDVVWRIFSRHADVWPCFDGVRRFICGCLLRLCVQPADTWQD